MCKVPFDDNTEEPPPHKVYKGGGSAKVGSPLHLPRTCSSLAITIIKRGRKPKPSSSGKADWKWQAVQPSPGFSSCYREGICWSAGIVKSSQTPPPSVSKASWNWWSLSVSLALAELVVGWGERRAAVGFCLISGQQQEPNYALSLATSDEPLAQQSPAI